LQCLLEQKQLGLNGLKPKNWSLSNPKNQKTLSVMDQKLDLMMDQKLGKKVKGPKSRRVHVSKGYFVRL
jgi:hypothetical protein